MYALNSFGKTLFPIETLPMRMGIFTQIYANLRKYPAPGNEFMKISFSLCIAGKIPVLLTGNITL
jgi:hypothetical protein